MVDCVPTDWLTDLGWLSHRVDSIKTLQIGVYSATTSPGILVVDIYLDACTPITLPMHPWLRLIPTQHHHRITWYSAKVWKNNKNNLNKKNRQVEKVKANTSHLPRPPPPPFRPVRRLPHRPSCPPALWSRSHGPRQPAVPAPTPPSARPDGTPPLLMPRHTPSSFPCSLQIHILPLAT